MMKKVISLVFGLLIGLAVWAQGTADTSASAKDSVSIGSHTEFSATKSADNVTKAQGDSAYMRNDYASAIQIYESLLKKGEAAEVYYNLGNSYYKADDIAKAILNYERALLLQPGNADIRANLEIARSKTIDKVVSVFYSFAYLVFPILFFQTDYLEKKRVYSGNSIFGIYCTK